MLDSLPLSIDATDLIIAKTFEDSELITDSVTSGSKSKISFAIALRSASVLAFCSFL